MSDITYLVGNTPLWTITALSAIIGDGIDTSRGPGSIADDGDRWSLVAWGSRAEMKPAFVCLEWQEDQCAVTITPGADFCVINYSGDHTVQRIMGYCAMHRIPCLINEQLVFKDI